MVATKVTQRAALKNRILTASTQGVLAVFLCGDFR